MEILVPISLGELYDKITILDIKFENIKDKDKLLNIAIERSFLKKIAASYPIERFMIAELWDVNKQIWEIEDLIRIKESKKEYDDKFITCARNIYYNNDKRAEIKKQINLKYNSSIIEEKSYESYEL